MFKSLILTAQAIKNSAQAMETSTRLMALKAEQELKDYNNSIYADAETKLAISKIEEIDMNDFI